MSEIIGGFNTLTNYLRNENSERKQELLKEKQKLSAQRIATGFKSITSNNNENDVRVMVYDLINDAASLDSLDANLGLINSLYTDSLNRIKQYKADKEDVAIRDYVEKTQRFDLPEGVTGSKGLQLYQADLQSRDEVDVTKKDGTVVHTVLNSKNEVISQIVKNEQTDKDRLNVKKEEERIENSYRNGGLKGYAGLTEDGLPMLLGDKGLYVQRGGKLEVYNEQIHGAVNKGSSYNDSPYKDFKEKLSFFKEQSKSGYLAYETEATSLAGLLGVNPVVDPITKKSETYFNALFKKYHSRQGVWNALRLQGKQLGYSKDALSELWNQYDSMMRNYEMNQNANRQQQIVEIEQKYGLGLDGFTEAEKQLPTIFNLDTSKMTKSTTLEQAKQTNQVNEWGAFQMKQAILETFEKRSGKKLVNPNYQDVWNILTDDEKGQIFEKLYRKQ